jgi:hypothetical protein
LAKSNYLGIFSGTSVEEGISRIAATSGWEDVAVRPLPPRTAAFDRRAVFGFAQGTTTQAIKDGLANTMAVAEHLRGASDRDARGAFWLNDASTQMLHATIAPNAATADRIHPRRITTPPLQNDWGCYNTNSPNNLPTDLHLCQRRTKALQCPPGSAGILLRGPNPEIDVEGGSHVAMCGQCMSTDDEVLNLLVAKSSQNLDKMRIHPVSLQ